jgi:hypothetical protein
MLAHLETADNRKYTVVWVPSGGRMKHVIIGLVLALAASAATKKHPVAAKQVDYGSRALTELNAGSYADAIKDFSKIIANPSTGADDRELALLGRGKAHLGQSNYPASLIDLRAAAVLRPSDVDVALTIEAAEAGPGFVPRKLTDDAGVGRKLSTEWGIVALLAGHTWLSSINGEPQVFVTMRWDKQNKKVLTTGLTAHGNRIRGSMWLDTSGRIISESKEGDVKSKGEGFATVSSYSEVADYRATLIKQRMIRVSDIKFNTTVEMFKDGVWTSQGVASTVEATPEMITQLGWKANPTELQVLLRGMGEAAKQGMIEGTRQGINDAIQQDLTRLRSRR